MKLARSSLGALSILLIGCGAPPLAPDSTALRPAIVGCAWAQSILRAARCTAIDCVALAGAGAYGEIRTAHGDSLYASVDGCVAAECPNEAAYLGSSEDRVLYGFAWGDCARAALAGPCAEFERACQADGELPAP